MNKRIGKQIMLAAMLMLLFTNAVLCQDYSNDAYCKKQTGDKKPVRTQDCLLWDENYNGKVKYVRESRQEFLMDTLVQLSKERGLKDWIDSMFAAPRCAVMESFFDSCGNITHQYRLAKNGDTLSLEKYFYDRTGNLIRSEKRDEDNRRSIYEYSLPLPDKKGNYYVNLMRTLPDGTTDTLKLRKSDAIFKRVAYPDSIQELLKKDSVHVSFELEQRKSSIIQFNITKNKDKKITRETHSKEGEIERIVQTFDYGSNSMSSVIYLGNKDKTKLTHVRTESKFDKYGNQTEYALWGNMMLELKTIWEIEYYE